MAQHKAILFSVICSLLSFSAVAGDLEFQLQQARDYQLQHKTGEAVSIWRRLANQGYAEAMYQLARYEETLGTKQGLNQAFVWYEKSAKQGHVKAQYNLGCLLENASFVGFDLEGAKYWFEKASSNSYRQATARLKSWHARHGIKSKKEYAYRVISAVKKNDARRLRQLIKKRSVQNITDTDGKSVLMIAAMFGHEEVAELLLNAGASVTETDHQGNTALHHAVMAGKLNTARQLIEAGGKLNEKNTAGMSPILIAARRSYPEIVRLLIEQGVDIDQKNRSGKTALDLAHSAGHERIYSQLTDAGAKLTEPGVEDALDRIGRKYTNSDKTYKDWPALNIAAWRNRTKEVGRLLQNLHAVDSKDAEGMTALQRAVIQSNLETVIVLLEHKAQVNLADHSGHTALTYAAMQDSVEIVDLLLKAGANALMKTSMGKRAVDYAIADGNENVALRLAQAPQTSFTEENLEHCIKRSMPRLLSVILENTSFSRQVLLKALVMSITQKNQVLVANLVQAGAPVSINYKNKSPLYYAVQADVIGLVYQLEQAGAQISRSNDENLLLIAAANGNLKLADYLLGQGIAIDVRDQLKNTPLMLAARNGHEAVVSSLIEKGANIRTRNRDGDNAEELAGRAGHIEIVQKIQDVASAGLWSGL